MLAVPPTGAAPMSKKLKKLLENTKDVVMTPEQRESQRRSFAYGNAHIENEYVTREMINNAADARSTKPNGSKGQ